MIGGRKSQREREVSLHHKLSPPFPPSLVSRSLAKKAFALKKKLAQRQMFVESLTEKVLRAEERVGAAASAFRPSLTPPP